MGRGRGEALLLCLLLFIYLFHLYQGLRRGGEPLNFLVPQQSADWVYLGEGFEEPGARHTNDAFKVLRANSMTHIQNIAVPLSNSLNYSEFQPGAQLELKENQPGVTSLTQSWMRARHRIILGIALDPDRMSPEDWSALPGIGEKLARRIYLDRQKNGDFGSIDALQRVPGVGKISIQRWRIFF